jgi:hypothetical protein
MTWHCLRSGRVARETVGPCRYPAVSICRRCAILVETARNWGAADPLGPISAGCELVGSDYLRPEAPGWRERAVSVGRPAREELRCEPRSHVRLHPASPDPRRTAAGKCGSMSREPAAARVPLPGGDAIASRRVATSSRRRAQAPRRPCGPSPGRPVASWSACPFSSDQTLVPPQRLVERAGFVKAADAGCKCPPGGRIRRRPGRA